MILPPGPDRFGVIVADPPWSYFAFTDAKNGAACSAMKVMSHADMRAPPVADLAADRCVLAMWATLPKLTEALDLMAAWGFDYVAGIGMVKTIPSTATISRGIGFWFPGACELVLFGRIGKVTLTKEKDVNYRGLLVGDHDEAGILDCTLYAPRTNRHSTKPETLQTNLMRRLPGPFCELFARRERPGWSCWGLETGWKITPRGVESSPETRAASVDQGTLFDADAD